jgi:hypothetical protein
MVHHEDFLEWPQFIPRRDVAHIYSEKVSTLSAHTVLIEDIKLVITPYLLCLVFIASSPEPIQPEIDF